MPFPAHRGAFPFRRHFVDFGTLLLLCMLGFPLVRRHTIYEKQLPSRSASPAHQRLIIRTLLERTTVRDILALRSDSAPEPISDRMPLPAVLEKFASSGHPALPVLDSNGVPLGVIAFEAVRHTLSSRTALSHLIVARDLAASAATVTPDQSLYSALARLTDSASKSLIVLESAGDKTTVAAVLTRGDINAIYDEQLLNPPEPAVGNGSTHLLARCRDWLRSIRHRNSGVG